MKCPLAPKLFDGLNDLGEEDKITKSLKMAIARTMKIQSLCGSLGFNPDLVSKS